MNLGWPSYLIHGTNKPAGVGLRASHGCIRMYPEDIATLFDGFEIGTKVTVVDQPVLYRWQGDSLYVQSYPPHLEKEEDPAAEKKPVFKEAMLSRMWQRAKPHGGQIDPALVEHVVNDQRRRGRPGIADRAELRGLHHHLATGRQRAARGRELGRTGGAADGVRARGTCRDVERTGRQLIIPATGTSTAPTMQGLPGPATPIRDSSHWSASACCCRAGSWCATSPTFRRLEPRCVSTSWAARRSCCAARMAPFGASATSAGIAARA